MKLNNLKIVFKETIPFNANYGCDNHRDNVQNKNANKV